MFIFWGKHQYTYGLILSGGGAKGAYQIGVFKALDELGIAHRVTALSGCSIGALNTLLFAAGGPDLWQEAWAQVSYDSFFQKGDATARSRLGAMLRDLVEQARGGTLEGYLARPPLFSQAGMEAYIRRFIDRDRLAATKLRLYCNAYNLERGAPENFCLNDYGYDDVIRLAMASSALPVVYRPVAFGGSHYSDGGMMPPYLGDRPENHEKVPAAAMKDEDCDIMIVVYLSHKDRVDRSVFRPGTRVLELYPSRPLERRPGTGTLDLAPEALAANQTLGYRDTMAAMAPIMAGRLRGRSLDEVLARHDRQNRLLLEAQSPGGGPDTAKPPIRPAGAGVGQ